MILFCEECGQKVEIADHVPCAGQVSVCQACGESLLLMNPKTDGGRRMQAAAALEHRLVEKSDDRKIKVLVVDDSKFFRRVFRQILSRAPNIAIVGEAANGVEALELIGRTNPDVVTMDVNMPVMDGIKALKHLMIKSPKPTVMFSTATTEGAFETFNALRYGAIDFISKPSRLSQEEIEHQQEAIVRKIVLAASVQMERVRLVRSGNGLVGDKSYIENMELRRVVILGASEGGYGNYLKIVPQLKPGLPMALIGVLYADPRHMDSFADYLGHHSQIRVQRAQNGQPLQAGTFYLVCGQEYATLEEQNHQLAFVVNPAPFKTRRGSIDILMFSLAELVGAKAMGVILSGSGKDGAEGVHEIHRVGGITMVQTPATCLVKEMPTAAIGKCSASRVISDSHMAEEINNYSVFNA